MKLTARDQHQRNALANAFHDRERFTLTGAGLQAEFVAETLNNVPCVFGSGRYETNLELVQVTEATTQAAWNGEGLPPVGTVCEAKMPPRGVQIQGQEWVWRKVEVVKSGMVGSESECLVFDVENTAPAWVDELRPIRTPEQTAAEDRELAIEDMVSQVKSGTGLRALCEQVFDAGYRKQ